MRYNKYAFYERAVQTPQPHVEQFVNIYREINGKYARKLREDFCGTFLISCEWVKRNRANQAMSLDLDPEPLAYGKKTHLTRLKPDQKKRLSVLRQNVLSATTPTSDLIVACNFSFFIFKKRDLLRQYFRACRRSLTKNGLLILEMAGGPGMIEPIKEKTPIYGREKKLFTYIWHQKSYDPISHDARYSIHFQLPSGETKKDVFSYDWRLWTIAEVREILIEAGFKDTVVYWESSHRGRGTGEYAQTQEADNAYAWIAYVVGII
jgi:hypothetical protein